MITKLDYVTRQLARAERKRHEHYVVTRIWHLLDDLTVKFVTQQRNLPMNLRHAT